jgi:predicted transcriptional regulator
MKMHKFDDMLKEQLKNPEFRAEYEALKEEFDVAKEVIRLRIGAGMTQKELAGKVHTSQPAIARLESGSYRNLSLSFLRRVGRALGAKPHVKFQKLKTTSRDH